MTGRLVSYSACQPPRTSSAAAMPDSVSPGRTTYRAAAAAGFAAAGDVAVTCRVTSVVLLAMRMLAWARGTDPAMPATKRVSSRPQTSTTHADFVHTRKVRHFPSTESVPNAQVRHLGTNHREGKDLRRRNLRQVRTPQWLQLGAARQQQQEQHQRRRQPAEDGDTTAPGTGGAAGAARGTGRTAWHASRDATGHASRRRSLGNYRSRRPRHAAAGGSRQPDHMPPVSPAAPPVGELRLAVPATGNPAVPEVSPSGAAPVTEPSTALPVGPDGGTVPVRRPSAPVTTDPEVFVTGATAAVTVDSTLPGTPAGAGVLGTTGADDPGTPPLADPASRDHTPPVSPAAPPVGELRLAVPATGNPAVPEVSPSGGVLVTEPGTALPVGPDGGTVPVRRPSAPVTTDPEVFVTGASAPVTVERSGPTVPVTGDSAPVTVERTGASVPVTGARTPPRVDSTGPTVPVTGPSTPVTVDRTGAQRAGHGRQRTGNRRQDRA